MDESRFDYKDAQESPELSEAQLKLLADYMAKVRAKEEQQRNDYRPIPPVQDMPEIDLYPIPRPPNDKEPAGFVKASNEKKILSFDEALTNKKTISFEEATDTKKVISFEDVVNKPHDWGTTDARDAGKVNPGMSRPEREGSAYDRAQLVAQEAFAQTPISGRDDGFTQLQQAKNIKTKFEQNPHLAAAMPQEVKRMQELEKEGTFRLSKYIMLREGLRTDISLANPSFVEQLVGGAAGGITDPLNVLGVANGGTVVRTMLKNFALGFTTGTARGLEQAEYDVMLKLADKVPMIGELLKQGFEMGAIAAALGGVIHIAGDLRQPKRILATDEAAKKIEADLAKKKQPKPEVEADSGQRLPDISKELGVETTVTKRNATLPDEIPEGQAGLWAMTESSPEPMQKLDETPTVLPPKSDLPELPPDGYSLEQAPDVNPNADVERAQTLFMDSMQPPDSVGPASVEGPLKPEPLPVAEALPDLESEFKTVRPENAVESFGFDRPKEQRVPYQDPQGAVPFDPFKDVERKSPGSPYMGRVLAEIASAENVPGTHEMDFDSAAYTAAREYEKMLIERFPDDITPQNKTGPSDTITNLEKFDGFVAHKPKVGSEIYRTKTLGQIIAVLEPYVPSHIRPLWDKMLPFVDNQTDFHIRDRGDPINLNAEREFASDTGVHALAGYNADGSQYVAIRGLSDGITKSGMSVTTIAHEIYHTVTKNAIRVGEDPVLSKRPEYAPHRKFAQEARKIHEEVLKKMDKTTQLIYRSELSNLDEFITWGSTDLTFKSILKNIKLGPENMWERMVRAVRNLFGLTDNAGKTALEAVMDLSNRFDEVTVSNAGMREYWDKKIAGKITKQEKSERFDQGNMSEQVVKDIYGIEDGFKLLRYLESETVGDLGYAIIKDTPLLKSFNDFVVKYFTTTNQEARIYRHPILLWSLNRIGRIKDGADARISVIRNYLQDVIALPRKDQLTLFKVLTNLQDISLRKQWVEAYKTNSIDKFLLENKMPEHLVDHAVNVLKVLEHVWAADQRSAISLGRDLPKIPGYFPKSHGGPFKFKISEMVFDPKTDSFKEVVHYVRGFKSGRVAQMYWTELKNSLTLPEGVTLGPVERVDVSGLTDSVGDMMTLDALPDYLKDQVMSLEERIEYNKRKFELERATRNVGGFIGELLEDDTPFTQGYAENSRLLEVLNQRIEDSWKFEVHSKIINEVVKPLMWDKAQSDKAPRLHKLLNNIVMRELGHDVAVSRTIDKAIQRGADVLFKDINKFSAKLHGYEASDISTLHPNSIKNLVQFWVWFTSAMKLGWNIPLWAVNTLAIPLVTVDGIRMAAKEGVNPLVSQHAFIRAMVSPWADPDAMKFMEQAALEGRITARQADLMEITEAHGLRGLRTGLDKGFNYPRNKIEEATNYFAILYYYNFYKLAKPDLNQEALTSKVYLAARGWTGDYSDTATPLHISNMGVAGRASGNFAKWMYNQTGRLLDDAADIRENPTKLQAYLPMIVNMTYITLMAGAMGLPIVAEYEYLRMIFNKIGGPDLKPFAAIYDDLQKAAQKHKMDFIPDWAKRGLFTSISDGITSWLTDGKEAGIDLSGSMRHAPILQANTVAIGQFIDIVSGLDSSFKLLWDSATGGSKSTEQDVKDALKMYPTSVQNLVTSFQRKERDGMFITQSKFNEEGEYPETSFENKLAMVGFKTTRKSDYMDKRQLYKWVERTKKEETTKLVDRMLSNYNRPEVIKELGNELASVAGIDAVMALQTRLEGRIKNKLTSFDENKTEELLNKADSKTKQELATILKDMRKIRGSRSTSSDH